MAFDLGGGVGESPLSEINIIPLVDVMLVLLIITMITSPFLEQGVNVDLPKADGQTLRKDMADEEPVFLVPLDEFEIVGFHGWTSRMADFTSFS